MSDIRQIVINGNRIGLVGLDEAFARARSREFESDGDLAAALVDLVAARNYVPEAGRGDYGKALLREFKIACGEEVEDDADQSGNRAVEVRVYGPGCVNCERLAAETISALSEMNLDADFEHVKDIDEIVSIMPAGLPALTINGRVVAAGPVPSREKIMELLKEATE
jgi:small redox-active disulfide protein 2